MTCNDYHYNFLFFSLKTMHINSRQAGLHRQVAKFSKFSTVFAHPVILNVCKFLHRLIGPFIQFTSMWLTIQVPTIQFHTDPHYRYTSATTIAPPIHSEKKSCRDGGTDDYLKLEWQVTLAKSFRWSQLLSKNAPKKERTTAKCSFDVTFALKFSLLLDPFIFGEDLIL